jgi:hypothetical protein
MAGEVVPGGETNRAVVRDQRKAHRDKLVAAAIANGTLTTKTTTTKSEGGGSTRRRVRLNGKPHIEVRNDRGEGVVWIPTTRTARVGLLDFAEPETVDVMRDGPRARQHRVAAGRRGGDSGDSASSGSSEPESEPSRLARLRRALLHARGPP